ncbi:pleckstrin homology domain-containing family A member 7 isoform X4 [Syngnathoides biaculeatus]|uniref:pleckstrin homology domain-containing family A member 7 isoform X4 n=1 Tax=Syngnathoides biaculeatus TaxID=300417 RepID=UPI002ADE3819|nr:pleckstrin homology domain-containing family A member 7 isoform X4 [Syngnathoides biaculeatus]
MDLEMISRIRKRSSNAAAVVRDRRHLRLSGPLKVCGLSSGIICARRWWTSRRREKGREREERGRWGSRDKSSWRGGIMAAPLGRDTLPDHWSYGVCRDGRVFFINDKTRRTTWLHPRTGEPVNSGHMIRSDLPRGWEEGFTDEGASYFINHNVRCTSFRHPVTGQISPENTEYTLQDKIESRMSSRTSPSMVAESCKLVTSAPMDSTSTSKASRASSRCHSFGKRDQAIKRNLNVPVVVRGWLYKQDSSGMRLWKRKWFVLSDFCLFYYKDSREETVLGSIPLPSYVIAPVTPEDHVNRKYAFKASHTGMRSYIYNKNSVIGSQAEHCGMRTYFFSADTQEDMNGWIRAMNQAALMQQSHSIKREREKPDKSIQQALPQTNHVNQKAPQSETLRRTDREQPWDDAVRPGPGEEGKYVLEVQGRPRPSDPRERLSPNPADGPPPRNGHQASALSQHHNGNLLYVKGAGTEKRAQRKNTLAQVEHWVKVQKGDPPKSTPSSGDYKPPRRTPPSQTKAGTADVSCQSQPKSPRLPSGGDSPAFNLPGDYKYAHDRLSHFRMSTDERVATKEGMVWQLYEWQQRQQFRHGSTTAPAYSGPNFTDSSSFTVTVEMPRSVSVPPSPCEVPPSASPSFKPLSPRRPHTPSGRRTVRPLGDLSGADNAGATSPGHIFTRLSQTSQMARRSMPAMGYITHTVSAPSLHGKTPEELTLLLVQLRRHQAKMAGVQSPAAFAHLQQQQQQQQRRRHDGQLGPDVQADDTYIQLKKDLEYLDLKAPFQVTGRESLRKETQRPVKIAESDADVKLSRLCEQDKILQDLEARIRTLKEDKDKLESVLDVSHQQMEQYRDQPAHTEKIAYQQKLLQEDVVHIRAEISKVSTEMENAWKDYIRLEKDVDWLKAALQGQMTRADLSQQEKAQMRKELWRVEDVIAGLSSSKDNYKVTISSVTNPERKFVPSVSPSSVPSMSGSPSAMEMRLSQQQHSPHLSPSSHNATTLTPSSSHTQQLSPHSPATTVGHSWAEEDVPPRPPLPQVYSHDEHPPAVPPLPRETTVIRHTSVRGLKRQSDERKRDREIGLNGDVKAELRPFLSDPELVGAGDGASVPRGVTSRGHDGGYQTLPGRGVPASSLGLNHSSSVSSFVTLRRATSAPGVKERSKSALERLYSAEAAPQRARMSADEQLERMKRHQKALVRQRKRTLSHGERQASASPRSSSSSSSRPRSADFGSWRREQEFDLQLLERAVQGEEAQGVRSVQGEERPPEHKERPRSHADDWLTFSSETGTPPTHDGLETKDYDAHLIKELSKPQKMLIPERYVDLEPEEPLSAQEMEDRHRKVERIKSILAKSSVQNVAPALCADKSEASLLGLDSVLQEQERIITMSYMLASEASLKSKQVTVPSQANSPVPPPPPPPLPPPPPPPPLPPVSVAPSASSPVSNGIHYTFV